MKIVELPKSRFKLLAKIDRRNDGFYIAIIGNTLEYPLVFKSEVDSWNKAVKGTRDLLCMMDAVMEYGLTGEFTLPPDLEHLREEIPAWFNELVSPPSPFVGKN